MSIISEYKEMSYGEALESDSIAQDWLKENKRRFGHFINGHLLVCNVM